MDILPPKRLEKPFQVPNRLLMGPGPSNCSPRVLQAMGQPTLGHMHPECFEIMDDVKEGIRYVFQTRNELTLAISASGHGGMEAVLCNLLESGDTVLVAVNGYWGERASDMASRYGANVVKVEAEPGDNFTLSKIEQAIVKHDPDVFFIVQGDSSTGVFQNLEGIGDICRRSDVLFVVDSVASLGAVPLFTDKWGIDAIYSGSQKVLGAPPGLAPISFSPKAQRKMFNRNSPVKVFYWDMTVLGHYWGCFEGPRIYHHTISSHLLYGLREALVILTVEGLENVIERHQRCSQRLYEGLKRLKLQFFVEEVHKRLPTVTAIIVPPCVVGHEVIDYAMKKHSLEIAGGLGPTANKVFRIGLMGYNATFEKTDFFLKVLAESLDYARSKKKNISKL